MKRSNAFAIPGSACRKRDGVPHDGEARRRGYVGHELWRRAGELGFLCVDIPEEWGGHDQAAPEADVGDCDRCRDELGVRPEGPGTLGRWFSQRVGWYHGLLKVSVQRVGEIRRITARAPFAMYHFVIYIGALTLALHFVKILSLALLVISLLGGMDDLFVADLLPRNTFTDPAYFVGTAAGYLALGVVALFTVVQERERSYALWKKAVRRSFDWVEPPAPG